jgi:ABC-type amino acid transport system permease subunit
MLPTDQRGDPGNFGFALVVGSLIAAGLWIGAHVSVLGYILAALLGVLALWRLVASALARRRARVPVFDLRDVE